MTPSTASRIPSLLHWQWRFDSVRALTWLIAGGYVLLAGPALQTLIHSLPPVTTPQKGVPLLVGLTVFHWLLAIGFPVFRASRSVDDRTSGVLALLKISNLSPGAWVGFRFLSVLMGYLPVWAVRLPLYVLAFHLGGVRSETILVAELFQWIAFFTIAPLGLLVARFNDTPSTARFAIFGVILLGEALLLVPLRILQGFRMLLGDGPILGNELLQSALVFLHELALLPYAWSHPLLPEEWLLAGGSILLHLLAGAVALLLLRRSIFFNVGVDDSIGSAAAERQQAIPCRPSRRVWDDALAWMCFHVHAGGPRTLKVKAVVYCVLTLLLLFLLVASPTGLLLILLTVSPPVVATVATFRTGDCVTRELRGETLSALALLPSTELEIYRGWKRGAWRLAIPDLLYVTAVLGLMYGAVDSALCPFGLKVGVGALTGGILLSTPFFFLNNLVSFDRQSLPVGCFSTFLALGVPIVSTMVAVGTTALAGLIVFVVLAVATHYMFTALIPRTFRHRMEQQS